MIHHSMKKFAMIVAMMLISSCTIVSGHLRGGIGDTLVATDETKKKESRMSGGGGFGNHCLKGRFSYFNTAANVASISTLVFDGMGSVTEMDTLLVNHEDGNGGRIDTPINFNDGTYELHSNGRGQLHISLGDPSGAYYDPPAKFEVVVSGINHDCEITAMDGFLVVDVGLASQMVAPHFAKMADE